MELATQPLVGIPIKPFGVAKQRLHPRLDASARSALGRAVAAHTVTVALKLAPVAVVTPDVGVRRWARTLGAASISEGAGTGLDGAATSLMDEAATQGRPWLLLHADLPLLQEDDLAALLRSVGSNGAVVSPSYDGGTCALGASQRLVTAYGAGSFHRHLRMLQAAAVVVRPGLAHDLDTVADLDRLRTHRRLPGPLTDLLGAIDSRT